MVVERRETADRILILDLQGKLTLIDGAEPLRDLIRSLVEEGYRKILLNLKGIRYVDSSGLGSIVAAFTLLDQQGGVLKLVHAHPDLERLLTVIEQFGQEDDALASFRTPNSGSD